MLVLSAKAVSHIGSVVPEGIFNRFFLKNVIKKS